MRKKNPSLCCIRRCRRPHVDKGYLCAKHGATPSGKLLEEASGLLKVWAMDRLREDIIASMVAPRA